jgi:hypothetical protein
MAFASPLPTPAPVSSLSDLTGEFPGGYYKIDHRDTNTLLSVTLVPNGQLYAQPGAMVAMSPEVRLKGKLKFSFKKMLTGSEMTHSAYTGPGEILLAPPILYEFKEKTSSLLFVFVGVI